MTTLVILFFAVALLFYALFAGADFGGGMVELFAKNERRAEEEAVVSHALAPVWEANHVWLILAVVILFTGFPEAYRLISTVFHIPLTVMLVGIVLRGCAFTFRHYDPFEDESRRWYSRIFITSSIITPLCQGLIVGGCMLGRIPSEDSATFATRFVYPWFNLFGLTNGLFVLVLFFFLAAVFLVGETDSPDLQRAFVKRSRVSALWVIVAAAMVFLAAEGEGFHLWGIWSSRISLFALPLMLCCYGLLLWSYKRRRITLARLCAGGIVGSVLLGWYGVAFPFIVGGHPDAQLSISLYDAAAPDATMKQLNIALIFGLIFILPFLAFLLRTFKMRAKE